MPGFLVEEVVAPCRAHALRVVVSTTILCLREVLPQACNYVAYSSVAAKARAKEANRDACMYALLSAARAPCLLKHPSQGACLVVVT